MWSPKAIQSQFIVGPCLRSWHSALLSKVPVPAQTETIVPSATLAGIRPVSSLQAPLRQVVLPQDWHIMTANCFPVAFHCCCPPSIITHSRSCAKWNVPFLPQHSPRIRCPPDLTKRLVVFNRQGLRRMVANTCW